jgi:hypothetical protein
VLKVRAHRVDARQIRAKSEDASGEPSNLTAAEAIDHIRVPISSVTNDDKKEAPMKGEIARLRQMHKRLNDNKANSINQEDYNSFVTDTSNVTKWMDGMAQQVQPVAKERKWGLLRSSVKMGRGVTS